jgi:hypothetical protein
MADEPRPEAQPAGGPVTIQTDETGASTIYSNFVQINLTAEEMVLSFGLNTQAQITKPIQTTHRVVMNFYTAKRLLHLLGQVIAQHEATFGVLELDAQRRARGIPRGSAPPSALKPGPA